MVQKRKGGNLPSNLPARPGILTYLAISPDPPPPGGVAAHFSATLGVGVLQQTGVYSSSPQQIWSFPQLNIRDFQDFAFLHTFSYSEALPTIFQVPSFKKCLSLEPSNYVVFLEGQGCKPVKSDF